MKKILAFIVSLLCGFSAHAQTTTADLMGLGMPGALAAEVTKIYSSTSPSLDGTTSVLFKINGTTELTVTNDTLTFSGAADTLAFGATSGTFSINGTGQVILTDGVLRAVTDNDIDLGSASVEFKDAYFDGTVTTDALNADGLIYITHSAGGILEGAAAIPADVLTVTGTGPTLVSIKDTSADADNVAFVGTGNHAVGPGLRMFKSRATDGTADTIIQSGDAVMNLTGLGANGTTYDPAAAIRMEIDTTPGAATDMPGRIVFLTTPDGSATLTEALRLTSGQAATFAGPVTSSFSGSLGWSYVTGANTACTTTCTSAAVFGVELTAGASQPVIVGPTDATADACVCAGAS